MPKSQGTSRKGKPKKAERAAGMGRALQKSQAKKFQVKSNGSSRHGAGMQASGAASLGITDNSELQASNQGMTSVLEVDDLTDFLVKAELANREFESEREQFIVMDGMARQVVRGNQNTKQVKWDTSITYNDEDNDDEYDAKRKQQQHQQQKEHDLARSFDFCELAVPRRPKWDSTTTPEQLDQNEKESFLQWRRAIAMKEEQIMASPSSMSMNNNSNKVSVTPFEKNLQVWRQLWRVLERSDCIALVVDGRNPLFYISMDLRAYVEQELHKPMIVVVNKCDYLTEKQRLMWHEYLLSMDGLEHVFFSAVVEQQILDDAAKYVHKQQDTISTNSSSDSDADSNADEEKVSCNDNDKEEEKEEEEGKEEFDEEYIPNYNKDVDNESHSTVLNPKCIGIQKPLTRNELLDILCKYVELKGITKPRKVFGMVGFPNVGKSSVLNVLVGSSKNDHKANRVGVASMPGKTKHFQTLNVPDHENITLCDCPGLVFPSFVSSYADLVLAGVYPLSQVRDYRSSIELICRRIPREILEIHFGIELPRPSVLDIAQRGGDATLFPPSADELLNSYCITRSLVAASSGIPDHHKASRVVLQDYVNGKILFCHNPPMPKGYRSNGSSISMGGMNERQWEDTFLQETFVTALSREKKLRDKLVVHKKIVKTEKDVSEKADNAHESKSKGNNDNLNMEMGTDLDILDILDNDDNANNNDNNSNKNVGGKRGKNHKKVNKWGKKGRKTRNKDPYGCHSEPDDALLGGKGGGGSGLVVCAGKYGSNMYTRPTLRGVKNVQ